MRRDAKKVVHKRKSLPSSLGDFKPCLRGCITWSLGCSVSFTFLIKSGKPVSSTASWIDNSYHECHTNHHMAISLVPLLCITPVAFVHLTIFTPMNTFRFSRGSAHLQKEVHYHIAPLRYSIQHWLHCV